MVEVRCAQPHKGRQCNGLAGELIEVPHYRDDGSEYRAMSASPSSAAPAGCSSFIANWSGDQRRRDLSGRPCGDR